MCIDTVSAKDLTSLSNRSESKMPPQPLGERPRHRVRIERARVVKLPTTCREGPNLFAIFFFVTSVLPALQ